MVTRKQAISFPEVGTIRKGDAKRKNEKGIEVVGKDLGDKFRVVFYPGTEGPDGRTADVAFFAHYETYTPKRILAMLPFRTLAESFTDYNEAYNAGRMIAQADDEHYLVYRNPADGEYLVQNGEPFKPYKPGDVIEYERGGKAYALRMKPYIRLKLWLPVFGRMVYMTLKSTSFYDRENIRAQLGGIQEIANALNNGSVAGIPFWVYRRETDITWNKPDGTAQRVKKWLINIEVDPTWVQAAMERYQRLAMGERFTALLEPVNHPAEVAAPAHAPDPEIDEDDEDVIDAESREIHKEEPESQKNPEPAARPYAPEMVRAKLADRAKNHPGDCSEKQRGLLVMMLEKCFAGEEGSTGTVADKRKAVIKFLAGHSSVKDIPGEMVKAMLSDWLKPQVDSGGDYQPDADAIREAHMIYGKSQEEAGQMNLL